MDLKPQIDNEGVPEIKVYSEPFLISTTIIGH